MSVALMAKVWDSALPSDERFVALCLADFADDEGTRIWPSQAVVARKVGKDERSVRRTFKKLIDRGVLIPLGGQGGGRGVTVRYRMSADALPKPDETPPIEDVNPDTDAPIPGHIEHETRTRMHETRTPTSDDPLDPPEIHQESVSHARVVSISARRVQSPEVSDLYGRLVEAGIQRPPNRWVEDWLERGVTAADIREAIKAMSEHARTPGTAYVNTILEGVLHGQPIVPRAAGIGARPGKAGGQHHTRSGWQGRVAAGGGRWSAPAQRPPSEYDGAF